jgi:NAD(P)-dependent dehydrogenase (short-subunit alcohol dehydrogenase family)
LFSSEKGNANYLYVITLKLYSIGHQLSKNIEGGITDSERFRNKVVVITGSGTGIGQTIAKKFAHDGANIIILGRRSEPLEKTAKEIEEIIMKVGSRGWVKIFAGIDVSDESGISEMFRTIKNEIGFIDILVNNAGVSGPVKLFTNSNFKEFVECVAIHLTGTFWTSVKCLENMKSDSKIVTISTFFTEENRWEQRPYRFRTPYTSAQGAKNRLAEALAWELVSKGIKSVATNPGPVHSDRIYKTVYPKAAAEFLRIGGYPGLTSIEIEAVSPKLLDLLGEDEMTVTEGLERLASELDKRSTENKTQSKISFQTLRGLLNKIQEIAEKVQANTKKMIVDEQFLSQDDVAEMVLTVSQNSISRLINGRIIPNDRVFYPVRPIIGTGLTSTEEPKLSDKVVMIIINSGSEKDHQRARHIAIALKGRIRQLIVLVRHKNDLSYYREFHCHCIDLSNEKETTTMFQTAINKFTSLDAVVMLTGEFDYNNDSLLSISRSNWDKMVEDYILIPALVTRASAISMSPPGVLTEPSLFKSSQGRIIIIGPDAPVGRKISGLVKARSEIFRGGLRPFNATVNQELRDVLNSDIRQYLLLCGNIDGAVPNESKITDTVLQLVSDSYRGNNQTIFYPDED